MSIVNHYAFFFHFFTIIYDILFGTSSLNGVLYFAGVVDSSGLRLYKTERLRQYDAGVVTLGHKVEPTHIIPPHSSSWNTLGHCTDHCTRAVSNLN